MYVAAISSRVWLTADCSLSWSPDRRRIASLSVMRVPLVGKTRKWMHMDRTSLLAAMHFLDQLLCACTCQQSRHSRTLKADFLERRTAGVDWDWCSSAFSRRRSSSTDDRCKLLRPAQTGQMTENGERWCSKLNEIASLAQLARRRGGAEGDLELSRSRIGCEHVSLSATSLLCCDEN